MEKRVRISLFLLCFMLPLVAFSGRDKVESAELRPTTVVGHVGVYGNEPHIWLGFVDQKGVEYALDATSEVFKELRNLQGVLLEISGFLEPVPEDQPVGLQTLSGGTIKIEEYSVYKE